MNKYTVCFLFTPDLSKVLLCLKRKTIYEGRWNGVGGKFENGESPWTCARREIEEETGCRLHPDELIWLGTTTLPNDCIAASSGKHDVSIELHFYAAIVDPVKVSQQEGEELIDWHAVSEVAAAPFNNQWLAGDGDVQYWVGMGYAACRRAHSDFERK